MVPQAPDMERAVLGAMLIDTETIGLSIELLKEDDFLKPGHAAIFRAITDLYDENLPIDQLTVADRLKKRKQLEIAGGEATLTAMINETASSANMRYHASVLREKNLLRQLISLSNEQRNKCFEDSADPSSVLEDLESGIRTISELRKTKSYVSMGEKVIEAQKELHRRSEAGDSVTGVDTGFGKLNDLTGGWQKSDLIILAGRPSMGKTAFGLDIAKNAALSGVPVAFFSLEMSTLQLVTRLICNEGRFNSSRLHQEKPDPEDWNRLNDAAARLHECKLFIDDTPGLSIHEFGAKAKRLKVEQDVGFIIVDYLQLMQGQQNKSHIENITAISRGLKIIAKELDIPVLALSQLSRAPDQRTGDHRPILSDLRDSGSIEQDADIVMFIYRASVYQQEPQYAIYDQDIPVSEVAEIIVRKQRNGRTGSLLLHWIGDYMRFGEFSYEPHDDFF